MNLYIAYNGYMGNGLVHCIVLAKTEEQAVELAKKRFQEEILLTL